MRKCRFPLRSDEEIKLRIQELIKNIPEASESNSQMQLLLASLASVNQYSSSLTRLFISISLKNVPYLNLLKDCHNLKYFFLLSRGKEVDDSKINLKLQVRNLEWLKQCKSLHTLGFHVSIAAPHMVYEILRQSDIPLK